jgi:hypothetical protein
MAVSVAVIVGFAVDAWVFTPHEWNPHWVGDVAVLPGVCLGGLVWVILGHSEAFALPCIIAGLASEWLLIGGFLGILVHLFRGPMLRHA